MFCNQPFLPALVSTSLRVNVDLREAALAMVQLRPQLEALVRAHASLIQELALATAAAAAAIPMPGAPCSNGQQENNCKAGQPTERSSKRGRAAAAAAADRTQPPHSTNRPASRKVTTTSAGLEAPLLPAQAQGPSSAAGLRTRPKPQPETADSDFVDMISSSVSLGSNSSSSEDADDAQRRADQDAGSDFQPSSSGRDGHPQQQARSSKRLRGEGPAAAAAAAAAVPLPAPVSSLQKGTRRCFVCNVVVSSISAVFEQHVHRCLEAGLVRIAPAASAAAGPSSNTADLKRRAVKVDQLPKVIWHPVKDKDVKLKLQQVGLPTDGRRQVRPSRRPRA